MAQCTPKSFDLTGKVALITGASYGIGMAIAKAMAANGATIVFNDIKQELVDKGIAAYTEAGIKAHGYVCDVTDEDAVNAMVAKITEEVGHINILVNNAGIIKRIPMTEMSAAQFRQVIDVDLNAPFIVAKAIIPDMIAQGGGKKVTGKYSKAVKFTTYVVPKVKKISVKNNKKGTITITASKVKGAAGYAFVITADSNLYDIVDIKESKKNTVTVKNLTKGHTYYIRACAYKLNKQKQKVFGVYAKKAKITIKK